MSAWERYGHERTAHRIGRGTGGFSEISVNREARAGYQPGGFRPDEMATQVYLGIARGEPVYVVGAILAAFAIGSLIIKARKK